MQDLAGVGAIINSKVAENLYQDSASGALQEVGKIGSDLAKTARLFLAPIQIAASFQNRFEKFLKNLENRVPENYRVEVHPQISGPALESMRYIDEPDVLWAMFCELLSKAADSRRVQYAHPSFVHILRQLTRDEVYLLTKLSESPFIETHTMDMAIGNTLTNRKTTNSTIPLGELHNPASFQVYYSHLESLSLIVWPVTQQHPIYQLGRQTGITFHSRIELTDFGRLFIEACTDSSIASSSTP
jgi:hypothetical protein